MSIKFWSVCLLILPKDYKVFSLADGFLLSFVFHLSQEKGVKKLSIVTVAKVFERYCDTVPSLKKSSSYGVEWCSFMSFFLKTVHAVSLIDQGKMQQNRKSKMLHFWPLFIFSLNLNMQNGCYICRIISAHACMIKKVFRYCSFFLLMSPSLAEYLLSRTSVCRQQLCFC